MQKIKGLWLQIVGAVAVAMLVGSPAFARSHHSQGSRGSSHSSSSGRMTVHAPRFESRGISGPRFGSRGGSSPRFESRGGSGPRFGSRGGSAPRFESRGSSGARFGSRAPSSFGRSAPFRGTNFYNSGRRFLGQGRIERVSPYRGGYHVWLGGWGYPFFIPYRFYNPFRFRLGLFIGFNAFYDPLGYYSVYDYPPYYGYAPVYRGSAYIDSNYRDGSGYRDDYADDGVLRGIAESIDLHVGTIVINVEGSRRVVTALLPPRDRRVDDIRPGDYVEFSGGWNRRGEFDADRMDRFEHR
jgi:hypothetical protein